jgi:hypothetical protein
VEQNLWRFVFFIFGVSVFLARGSHHRIVPSLTKLQGVPHVFQAQTFPTHPCLRFQVSGPSTGADEFDSHSQ